MDMSTRRANGLTGSAVLTNAVGLHARPSVKLTQLAKSFSASIDFALAPDGPWTDAKSPVKVMRVKAPRAPRCIFASRAPTKRRRSLRSWRWSSTISTRSRARR